MHGNCKCPHHIVAKVLNLLAWVAAVLFFWSSWSKSVVWGFDAGYYAWDVVVLSLLAFGSVFCGCCRKGKMIGDMGGNDMKSMEGVCTHEAGCSCGDCDRCK